jgi:hypothetical protein
MISQSKTPLQIRQTALASVSNETANFFGNSASMVLSTDSIPGGLLFRGHLRLEWLGFHRLV